MKWTLRDQKREENGSADGLRKCLNFCGYFNFWLLWIFQLFFTVTFLFNFLEIAYTVTEKNKIFNISKQTTVKNTIDFLCTPFQ